MGIEGISNQNVPQTVQQPVADAASAQVQQAAVAEIAPLFGSGQSVNVQETRRVENTAAKRELSNVPELDDADAALLAGISADLEALIALLQAEQDEKAVQATKTRIESLKGQLQAHHEQTMAKVNETIDEMKKQEKSALANKILGWLGAVFAVVTAVALCCTGVGVGVAVTAIVGAALSVTMMGLNEGGVMDKLTTMIADSLKKTSGLSAAACDALAQGIMAGIQIAISLACVAGAGAAVSGASSAASGIVKASEAVVKGVKIGMFVANTTLSAASIASSTAATVINYNAAEKQADVTDMQQLLIQLQTMLDQESDDLKVLLAQLNDALAAVIELLESKQDALNNISQQIGA